jgi:hypothetical protein
MCNSASVAVVSVHWESMTKFDPEGFARLDLVEDDINPADLSPDGQQKLRDLALARLMNNALLALRWRTKKPTATQIRGGMHMIQSDRCMSDFNFDITVIIIHHYNTRSCIATKEPKPCLVSKRWPRFYFAKCYYSLVTRSTRTDGLCAARPCWCLTYKVYHPGMTPTRCIVQLVRACHAS